MPKLPDKFINWTLISEPLNWAVLFAAATIWLLAFHVIMKGFGAMQGQAAFSPGPGLTAAPGPSSTGVFSRPGSLSGKAGNSMNNFYGGGVAAGDGTWTDGYDAQFAQDGWDGNP